jgi:hypothetical protein
MGVHADIHGERIGIEKFEPRNILILLLLIIIIVIVIIVVIIIIIIIIILLSLYIRVCVYVCWFIL